MEIPQGDTLKSGKQNPETGFKSPSEQSRKLIGITCLDSQKHRLPGFLTGLQ
jgi:hypothetical protein